mgnify:CR=1 FL=1
MNLIEKWRNRHITLVDRNYCIKKMKEVRKSEEKKLFESTAAQIADAVSQGKDSTQVVVRGSKQSDALVAQLERNGFVVKKSVHPFYGSKPVYCITISWKEEERESS